MNNELLNHIVGRLDVLISLNLPPFKKENYAFSGVKLAVIELCDYEHTAKDMVKELKKSRNQIDVTLSWLRSRGLVRSVAKAGKTYYVRVK